MTTTLYEVWVCVDCYMAHHYGNPENPDPSWSLTEDQRAYLDSLTDWTDSETGEGIDEFSWSPCDVCGSTLGGSRERLAEHVR